MEFAIYGDSPLAEYLEGSGVGPKDFENTADDSHGDHAIPSSFAPLGRPTTSRARLYGMLHGSSRVRGRPTQLPWHRMMEFCLNIIVSGMSRSEDERFLERFRYVIIASQLLVEQSKASSHKYSGCNVSSGLEGNALVPSELQNYSVQGVAATTILSFVVAGSFHWLRGQLFESKSTLWTRACMLLVFFALLSLAIYTYARRRLSLHRRQDALEAVSSLIAQARSYSDLANASFIMIQEVEIVARGYQISQPLPPVSRLEDKDGDRHCASLRHNLASSLTALTKSFVAAHDALQSWTDVNDMQRYHDIYEVSHQDYHDCLLSVSQDGPDSTASLRDLRILLQRLFVARQIALCDLLALPARILRNDTDKWSTVSEEILNLVRQYTNCSRALSDLLLDEDQRGWGSDLDQRRVTMAHNGASVCPGTHITPSRLSVKAQMRHMDSLYHSIRTLYAKMQLFREECNLLGTSSEENDGLSATLNRQYDAIGADLRGLLADWDRGRNTMLLSVERSNRLSSRSSSGGLQSPMSPACSLGGLTEVDGSPAEALKMLSEEVSRSSIDADGLDEEVFEAIAIPTKRLSMTREEKIAKMKEDRQRRRTFHERADANTNMLRELETVIKHRPRGRTASPTTSL